MSDSKKEAASAAPAPSGKPAAKAGAGAAAKVAKASKATASKANPLKAAAKDASKVTKVKRGVQKRNKKARLERKQAKIAAAKALKESKDGALAKKKRKPHREIASGVMRFSRPYTHTKKGSWKFVGEVEKAPKKPRTIRKEIGGEKNGGFREVLQRKRRNNYPTADPIKKRRMRGTFKKHTRYTRRSLKPGTICILLAGIHRGKRVVLLKVLKSGLLLINGPYTLNGVPLRRVNQNFVIATRTRLDLPERIPAHVDDNYFKRERPKKSKKEEGDIFSTKKEKYAPSEQRKADQKVVDKIVLKAIKKFGEKRQERVVLIKYLKSMFGLKRNQLPHYMRF